MKSIVTYSLGSLAYITATEGKDPNTFVTKQSEADSSGIIWNEDKTLCLMMDNFFIDTKVGNGQDWRKIWGKISANAERKQRHIDEEATPRCEDTKVFWSTYCFDTLNNNYYFDKDESQWLAEDPNVEKALFRVSVHADMDDIFCIIPEGDYCLKEEPGTYKMQSVGYGRKFEKFRFLPFDGVNPDYYFDFDGDDILVYGSDSTGWEKLNVQGNNGRSIKRINVGNAKNWAMKVQNKRLRPINFGSNDDDDDSSDDPVISPVEEAQLIQDNWNKYTGELNGQTTQLFYKAIFASDPNGPGEFDQAELKAYCQSLHEHGDIAVITSVDEYNFLVDDSFVDYLDSMADLWDNHGTFRFGCQATTLVPTDDPYICDTNENLELNQPFTALDWGLPSSAWYNGQTTATRGNTNRIEGMAIVYYKGNANHKALNPGLPVAFKGLYYHGICQIRVIE